jgi:sugar lactone lactonase YvrE
MKYPYSLAACPHNNCLYVSDAELKHIHRVDLSSSSVSKWSVDDSPFGLSVTRNHHLLVTLPRSKRIREYTTHGDVMREINLDVSIDRPRHSIELSSGQFVVCHVGATQHRVCTVDTSGRIVQSYGGLRGLSAGQLNSPFCLAVDKRGYVLVADWDNYKVQILSPALTHLCDVTLPGHGLSFPCSLHVDEQRGRLYVGEGWGEGRVFVLAVQ